MFSPIFAVFALLSCSMAPAVVAWHNSGTQPQPYSLVAAITLAGIGAFCVLALFWNVLNSKH